MILSPLQDLYETYKNAIIRITVAKPEFVLQNSTTLPFIKSSGFLIRYHNKFYAITCAHNVLRNNQANRPAEKIYGTVNNVNGTDHFKIFPLRIVCVDVHADIAVLQFPRNALHPCKNIFIKFENNLNQRIGGVCWTSGNPLGSDEASFVAGTIRDNKLSGVNGLFIIELISYDLLVYANNSGCPILNSQGKVIGICSYTYNNVTTGDPLAGFGGGCGSYMMKPIVYNLIDGRHSSRINHEYYQYQKPYFGDTEFVLLTSDYILYHYPDNYKHLDVVGFVLNTLGNNPFKRAGLRQGDIITQIRNKQGVWVKLGAYDDYYAIGSVLWEYNPKYKPCVEIEYIPDPNCNCRRYYKKVTFDQKFPVDETLDTSSMDVTFLSYNRDDPITNDLKIIDSISFAR